MKRAAPRKDGSTPMIPAISKGDAKFIELSESDNPAVRNLAQARLAVRSSSTTIARLTTMQKYIDWGIGIPVHLVYYGGHTGRFSGGGGFNWQNLTSPDRAQNEIDKLIAKLVREAVEAPLGKVFVPVDAAQIEVRVLAWLAGQDDLTADFAAGADIYSKFISEVLGEDIHKPTDEDKKDPAKAQHLVLMRGAGKIAVLGLGFQMGADKFFWQLENKDKQLAKLIKAGKITLDFAAQLVKAYRDKYTKIAAFWGKIERAFHRARQGITTKLGPLTLKRVGVAAVAVILPSGRALYYRNIRQEERKNKRPKKYRSFADIKHAQLDGYKELEWKHGAGQKIYGGMLTENVVQAIARDILVEQGIFAAEQAGYPVALHVHDEVVPLVEESDGQRVHDFLVKSLSTPPTWGEGMALSAEGKISKTLAK
jgi:DNA polymerase